MSIAQLPSFLLRWDLAGNLKKSKEQPNFFSQLLREAYPACVTGVVEHDLVLKD